MLFNSLNFLVFLPLFVVVYYLVNHKYRWITIFLGSCYFYMSFVPKYILILFTIICIDYVSAILIEKQERKKRWLLLIVSLCANIGLLAFFKYFNFINENISSVFALFGKHVSAFNLDIILPIGLSFHTFQSMAYTIDVYQKKQRAEKHLGYFANYVLFFPQMVAGPIERFERLGQELKKKVTPSYLNFSNGCKLILYGFFIKMVVADNIAPFVNEIYANPSHFNGVEIISSIFLFSIQIYADFFGYSTIAIGCALLLGIKLMDNFNSPFFASSLTDFWSKWHISLSTWFKDYLYIPLGGNRVSYLKWCFNILTVFTISGIWHGANWNFVVWGLLHGITILLERLFNSKLSITKPNNLTIKTLLLSIKTFIVVSVFFVFFRAETIAKAMEILKSITNTKKNVSIESLILPIVIALIVFFIFEFVMRNQRFDAWLNKQKTSYRWITYTLLLFFLLAMSGTQKFSFIYFQF